MTVISKIKLYGTESQLADEKSPGGRPVAASSNIPQQQSLIVSWCIFSLSCSPVFLNTTVTITRLELRLPFTIIKRITIRGDSLLD